MINLYRAVVSLIEAKAGLEQARSISILQDCGVGLEALGLEVEVEEAAGPSEPELGGQTLGFTGSLEAQGSRHAEKYWKRAPKD